MEKEYIKSVIILIGGAQLPDESMKQYLARVSLYTGIPYRSLRAAYYGQDINPGQYISSNTREKLEKALQHVQRPHALIVYIEHQIAVWEADPTRYRPWIDAARVFLVQLQRADEASIGTLVRARGGDVGGGRRAGGAAAAASVGTAACAAAAT